jgi:hypothetical protein
MGQTSPHYRIVENVGNGTSMVCAAEDIFSQRSVALKFLPDDVP